jgi:hypothetical protein
MAVTTLTAVDAPGSYTAAETLAFVAPDAVDGAEVRLAGGELILARNTTAGALNATLTSVADPATGRTGNLVKSVPANGFAVFGPMRQQGWRQPNGTIKMSGAAGIEFAVIRP